MYQIDTTMDPIHPPAGLTERIRIAAMTLTLLLGIPLTLAWFALIGWGMMRIVLAIL